MSYDFAQTFYIDPAAVKNSDEVGISKVNLYFRGKPKPFNNKSGIRYPGVSLFIVPTLYGIPLVNEYGVIVPQEPTEHGARFNPRQETARVEWSNIQASTDGATPTEFVFKNPVFVDTNHEYAIIVKYDGHEDYLVWFSREGDTILGGTTASPGPSGQYIGKYYSYISPEYTDYNPTPGFGYDSNNTTNPNDVINDPTVANFDNNYAESTVLPSKDYLLRSWRPTDDVDLKFEVFVARYYHNGYPVAGNNTILDDPTSGVTRPAVMPTILSNNTLRIPAPSVPIDYIMFNRSTSATSNILFGDRVYQNAPLYPGGTATPLTIAVTNGSANVTANGSWAYANGDTFNNSNGFYNIFTESSNNTLVIKSGNNAIVRTVREVTSNTTMVLSEPVEFTNTVANFMITPTATLVSKSRAFTFGTDEDMLRLAAPRVNSSFRFVNNSIESIGIANDGVGYSNSDYITINGYENVAGEVEGGYPAVANIVTNGSGGITAIHMANLGCGFVNTAWLADANISISNSSGQPVLDATANGAEFTFDVGSTIHTTISTNAYFKDCRVINIESSLMKPEITVNNPVGSVYNIFLRTMFRATDSANTYSGKKYFIDDDPAASDKIVKIFKEHLFETVDPVLIPSKSNEFWIPYSNGSYANHSTLGGTLSNSAVYFFDASSNNDYIVPFFEPQIINSHFAKYIINNDYTNEHTNYGNAYAKHVVTKVNFNTDRFAEDCLIYLTGYRPVGTDFKVYVRIHNANDEDAFDDKDWTLLEEVDGIGAFSTIADPTSFVELTYGFPASPNTEFTLDGTVETTNNSVTITGSGTDFSSNLASDDLIKIYSPLFTNNYVVGVVDTVTNSTSMDIHTPITNNNVLGAGFKVDKLEHKQQAFNNQLNDNVVRYYNMNMSEFDTYNTFQVKVVMLSNNISIVPKIDDIRGIGVSV